MIISYVLMCMLMIFLAFGIHNKYLLMKNVAVLYGAALFTAGVFLFLENLQISNSPILIEKQPASGIGGMARSWGIVSPLGGGVLSLRPGIDQAQKYVEGNFRSFI